MKLMYDTYVSKVSIPVLLNIWTGPVSSIHDKIRSNPLSLPDALVSFSGQIQHFGSAAVYFDMAKRLW